MSVIFAQQSWLRRMLEALTSLQKTAARSGTGWRDERGPGRWLPAQCIAET